MSDGKKPGFLHFLRRLFGLGGDEPKPAQAAPAKKNRPSHAPKRKPSGKGSAQKEPPSDKPGRRSLLRATSPQRRSPPSQSPGPSLRPRLLPHRSKLRGKFPHTNGLPPTGRRRVPRRRPRLPFTPLSRPRSLRGRLNWARTHRPLLALQRLQARRPRTCLR